MEQYLNFSKSEVCQFVHEAVEQCLGSTSVHTELSLWGEVVRFLQGRQHITGDIMYMYKYKGSHAHVHACRQQTRMLVSEFYLSYLHNITSQK